MKVRKICENERSLKNPLDIFFWLPGLFLTTRNILSQEIEFSMKKSKIQKTLDEISGNVADLSCWGNSDAKFLARDGVEVS